MRLTTTTMTTTGLNQPINQASQSTNQPINQPTNQPNQTSQPISQWFLQKMRREQRAHVVRPLFRAGGRGVRYPPPRTPTSNGTNKPKVPLVDFWA